MKPHPGLPQAFADLGIEVRFLKALQKMQFVKPTDIQRAMIPPALQGRDILGQARTGTGKTAAFALPTLQRLDECPELQALCVTPTRELAVQVAAEVRRLAEFTRLKCIPVYGGQKIALQLHLLGRRQDVLVGTPGRLLDLLRRRAINFDHLRVIILDEVDRMLDIGFRDDIKAILSQIKGEHQTILVSATIEEEVNRLARQFMTDPLEANVSQDTLTVDEVEQYYVSVTPVDKYRMLRLVMAQEQPKLAIIFCNTKHGVRKLAKKLHRDQIEAREIHGDLVQGRRERVMDRFRRHQMQVLVATDLAARGIDVSAISHIINYDTPQDPQGYVHRIGRTARMGACGRAVTFVTPDEGKELTEIEKLINKQLTRKEFEGFVASEAPSRPEIAAPEDQGSSRYREPVFSPAGSDSDLPKTTPPRTLGSKFRPRRRRRL
ncbi:MAG TPA: DEAD/DEAH box helicase [Phycisphaerae bacterium]|nr:DEAD/DEAH box helicase [Phycisphaerae bacterium]